MSILIDAQTKVITQGFTSNNGVSHSRQASRVTSPAFAGVRLAGAGQL